MEIFVLLRTTQNVKIGHDHKSWVAKEIDKSKLFAILKSERPAILPNIIPNLIFWYNMSYR